MDIYLRLKLYLKTLGSLISRDWIGRKVNQRIRLNSDLIRAQPNMVNVNETDYGGWNEWDAQWSEGEKTKYGQWSVDWMKGDETWSMKSIR